MGVKRKHKRRRKPIYKVAPSFRIFIGNIGLDTTINDLWNLFEDIGYPDHLVVHSERIKVYAFARCSTVGAAQVAIDWIDGYVMNGRKLKVYFACWADDG